MAFIKKVIFFFITGMIGVAVSIYFLVNASLNLFDYLGFSRITAGVTILAAATSLPDTFLSVISAKKYANSRRLDTGFTVAQHDM